MGMSKLVSTTVRITKEQMDWLHKRPDFNLSGFVRIALRKYIELHGDEVFVVERGAGINRF